MERFEQIRREYDHGAGTIRAVARKLGVYRRMVRMVRQTLASALPPERKRPEREQPDVQVSESTVRRYVCWKKRAMGVAAKEVFIAQTYKFGEEAQVDWYEAYVNFSGDEQKVYVFRMRSMESGAGFHCAYLHATQQAFLEAHELVFARFGGVFGRLRYV